MTTPTTYATHLRVGSHTWDVDSNDPPAYGPLAGVRFTWDARQDDGWPTQHNPTVLVLGIIVPNGSDLDDVDQGTGVHFTFTPEGYAAPLVTFGGEVRDLTGTPHPLGMVYQLTAVDHLVKAKEEYTTSATIALGAPASEWWTALVQDASFSGIGTRPAIVDPFSGDTRPYQGGGATPDAVVFDPGTPTWDALTGALARGLMRIPAPTGPYQRGVLTYRLDGAGNLDTAKPFQGTWVTQAPRNAPLELVEGPDGWTAGGGNAPASVTPTAGVTWSRERMEPNRTQDVGGITDGQTLERPHTGPDITRYLNTGGHRFLSDVTDRTWVLSGTDAPDQWTTTWTLAAARAPELVDGWFTLPHAMRTLVAVHGIDPRHTPSGTDRMLGMLGGASLVIPPGGDWRVTFRLRRTLPDRDDATTGGWGPPADAITWAELEATHPTLTAAALSPTLTWADAYLIGD